MPQVDTVVQFCVLSKMKLSMTTLTKGGFSLGLAFEVNLFIFLTVMSRRSARLLNGGYYDQSSDDESSGSIVSYKESPVPRCVSESIAVCTMMLSALNCVCIKSKCVSLSLSGYSTRRK